MARKKGTVEKPKTDRKRKTVNQQKTDKKRKMLFGIRNKIMIGFLVPVLFMVVIGVAAYRKASGGMSEKYRESTAQTINTAMEYVDMICSFIESEGMKYAFDSELNKYLVGLYEDDTINKAQVMNETKTAIFMSKTSNKFISNIHIVTKENIKMLTTVSITTIPDGIYPSYKETVADGRGILRWVDDHELLDTTLKIKKDSYIMAYQIQSQNNNACIVVDIDPDKIKEFLEGLDLGQGSIVGFVTKNGRELVVENLPEGEESILTEGENVFYGQEFFPEMNQEEPINQGTSEVSFHGEKYLFFFNRSERSEAMVCALVPMETVIGQAEEIKSITVGLVVLACVIVLAVCLLIVFGIQNNMRRISGKLGEVAQGDLTVQVKAKGRDEFRGLADSANNMIENTKKLVDKVNAATVQLEDSARDVEHVSGVISNHSADITQAVNEISETMTQQTANVQECVAKTDILSEEMQEVSRVVEQVEKLVDETEDMIGKGMDIVQVLGEKARQTTEITAKVGENINSLRRESEIINSFVGTITEISEQTNLLSLNASIEAARAGEAGRGFSVVAEEIRKLADDSAAAAGEIRTNVEQISACTMSSVDSAREAQDMVASQTEAVEQVISVFREMQERMRKLVEGLEAIVESTEKADAERSYTVTAIRQISGSIEETANSAMTVRDAVEKLMNRVEGLNKTADALGENMDSLKSEISVFKG